MKRTSPRRDAKPRYTADPHHPHNPVHVDELRQRLSGVVVLSQSSVTGALSAEPRRLGLSWNRRWAGEFPLQRQLTENEHER